MDAPTASNAHLGASKVFEGGGFEAPPFFFGHRPIPI